MHTYLNSILWAVLLFPLLALILTIPYMIVQYHQYGAITKKRTLIVYSFIFYLLCIYFLVILPLPQIKDVFNYQGKWYNLKPFTYINDLSSAGVFKINNPRTYISLLTSNRIIEPLFNVILMIPFGIYLRYYFNKGWFTTILYTLIFSLFLEITQLSGLYYIYPRPYRMFDVNDLIMNTLGGLLGFIITPIFSYFLPSSLQLKEEVLRKSKNVTFSRRFIGYLIDIFIISLVILIIPKKLNYLIILLIIIFYFSLSLCLFNGKTIGKKIVNIKINTASRYKYILRSILFEGLFLHIYLILLFLHLNILYAILIQVSLYLFLLFEIICRKYYHQQTLLIDKLLNLEIVDTIKHEETYIIKL